MKRQTRKVYGGNKAQTARSVRHRNLVVTRKQRRKSQRWLSIYNAVPPVFETLPNGLFFVCLHHLQFKLWVPIESHMHMDETNCMLSSLIFLRILPYNDTYIALSRRINASGSTLFDDDEKRLPELLRPRGNFEMIEFDDFDDMYDMVNKLRSFCATLLKVIYQDNTSHISVVFATRSSKNNVIRIPAVTRKNTPHHKFEKRR